MHACSKHFKIFVKKLVKINNYFMEINSYELNMPAILFNIFIT